MSVTELAERLGRPKGTVAYHVDILRDAGVLKVVRTRRVRAVEERYYGRVARSYVFPATPGEVPFLQEFASRIDHERWGDRHDDHSAGLATLRYSRPSAARAAEYRDRLLALALEFVDEPREGDTEFGMYLALFPTVDGAESAT
jgi:DNA-binding transcriptional ArsR family regulator